MMYVIMEVNKKKLKELKVVVSGQEQEETLF